jgi:CHASE1-domain containing sensor protein
MLAWAPRIPASRRKTHEEAVRHEGLPKYEISQREKGGRLATATDRDKYYPILFAEPSGQHESLIGFDLGSDAALHAAMRQATASRPKTAAHLKAAIVHINTALAVK